MADINDVINAEREASEALNYLDDERGVNYNIIMGITAISKAIIAVGVRLDYVMRDSAKELKTAEQWRRDG